MPGRNSFYNYRYAYQGQEKDTETGKEAFELRLWDARIGRWLTTDPYGQYHSPYLGMGNSPINGIDPDGGLFGWVRAKAHQLFNGGDVTKNDNGKWIWSKTFTQYDSPNDNIVNFGGIEIKSFGYGGLGKLESFSRNYSVKTKVDAGIVFTQDSGVKGITAKLATVTLFDGGIEYDNLNGFKSLDQSYYFGKNGVFKGSGPSSSIETGKVDIKAGSSWSYSGDEGFNVDTYYGVGRPYLEAKANITKKGLSVHLGIQEDWGKSYGFWRVIGVSGKLNVKGQLKGVWVW